MSMSNNVGIFDAFFESQQGGTQVTVRDLINIFTDHSIRPIIVCLGRENNSKHLPTHSIITIASKAFEYDLLSSKKDNRSKWFIYHLRRFFNKKLATQIAKVFSLEGVNHVLLQNLSVASYALPAILASEGLKVTVFCRDYEWIMPSTLLNTPKFHPLYIIRRIQSYRAKPYIQKYIANSKFMQKCMYNSLGNDIFCDVLYPILDTKLWKNQRIPSHIPKATLRCIYSGSLVPEKGIVRFLQQINILGISWLNISIYGKGPQRAEVETYCNSRITLHEHVDSKKMRDIFAEGDFTIVPSLWDEPFGRVAFESILSGCPVLATNRGGLTEQQEILPGVLLYDPDNIKMLKQQIIKMKEITQLFINPSQEVKKIQQKNLSVMSNLIQDILN